MSSKGNGPDVEARLRAADPAADAEPDLAALRAAVRDHVERAPADQLAARRGRRTGRLPVRAASVAAAALLVGGGGGYAVGAAGGAEEPAGVVVTLDRPEGPDSALDAPGLGPQTMPGSAEIGREGAEDTMSWPGYGGRSVFSQSGLSTEAGSAAVRGFDTASAYSAAAVRAAAEVLGVPGAPREQNGTWTVGEDGGPTVQLYADGTVSLGYWDPAKDPWSCDVVVEPRVLPDEDEGETNGGSDAVLPVEPCTERDLGAAPTGDAAVAAVRDVLAALGVPAGDYEYVAESWGEEHWSSVTAHLVVDGERTDVQWSATLTGAGLQALHGSTAPLVELGEYAVVSPAEAVERLMDPRFGASGPVGWLQGRGPTDQAVTAERAATVPPGTPEAGTAIAWPVQDVTIVEARLGAALHWQADGRTLLVPTYVLVDADGALWSVLAVADTHLDTASR